MLDQKTTQLLNPKPVTLLSMVLCLLITKVTARYRSHYSGLRTHTVRVQDYTTFHLDEDVMVEFNRAYETQWFLIPADEIKADITYRLTASSFEYDGIGFTHNFDRHSVSKGGKLYVNEPNINFNDLNHGDITDTYTFSWDDYANLVVPGNDGRKYFVFATQAVGLTPLRFGTLVFNKGFICNFRLYESHEFIKPRGWSLIQAYIATGIFWIPLVYYLYKIL